MSGWLDEPKRGDDSSDDMDSTKSLIEMENHSNFLAFANAPKVDEAVEVREGRGGGEEMGGILFPFQLSLIPPEVENVRDEEEWDDLYGMWRREEEEGDGNGGVQVMSIPLLPSRRFRMANKSELHHFTYLFRFSKISKSCKNLYFSDWSSSNDSKFA